MRACMRTFKDVYIHVYRYMFFTTRTYAWLHLHWRVRGRFGSRMIQVPICGRAGSHNSTIDGSAAARLFQSCLPSRSNFGSCMVSQQRWPFSLNNWNSLGMLLTGEPTHNSDKLAIRQEVKFLPFLISAKVSYLGLQPQRWADMWGPRMPQCTPKH